MNTLQRTQQWLDERTGKFTSSEQSKLMGIKCLGKTGESYALCKAIELFIGRNLDEGYVSYDMQRGNELEPLAYAKLESILALDFINVEPCGFIAFDKNTGGSPDGLYGDYGVFDIKCPKPEKFFSVVLSDEIDSDYVIQLQHQMMVTNRTEAISFQYCIYNGVELWHKITFKRDDAIIEKMKERIAEAVIIRDNYLKQLKTKKQWN